VNLAHISRLLGHSFEPTDLQSLDHFLLSDCIQRQAEAETGTSAIAHVAADGYELHGLALSRFETHRRPGRDVEAESVTER
jgi:hypothetical protein